MFVAKNEVLATAKSNIRKEAFAKRVSNVVDYGVGYGVLIGAFAMFYLLLLLGE